MWLDLARKETSEGTSIEQLLQRTPREELLHGSTSHIWVDLCNPTNYDLMLLANTFGIHPTTIEDAMDPEQQGREKLEVRLAVDLNQPTNQPTTSH